MENIILKLYVGIDFSISSPAMCVQYGKKIDFYFFSQSKKQGDYIYHKDNIYIESFPYWRMKFMIREAKFDYLATTLLEKINFISHKDNVHGKDIIIGIEGYSFGSKGRGCSALYEGGGILRNLLYNHNYTYQEIPPTSLKMHFCGKGNGQCSKWIMWYQFKKQKIVNLFKVLGFKKKEIDYKKVPNPIEDIVDAYALTTVLKEEKLKKYKLEKEIWKK